jgi:hypothetical protein
MPWRRMGIKIQLHTSLTSVLDRGEWSASRCGRFTPGTHWIEDWVDLRAGLDQMAKRRNHCLFQRSNPGRPARNLVTYIDWAIPKDTANVQIYDSQFDYIMNIFWFGLHLLRRWDGGGGHLFSGSPPPPCTHISLHNEHCITWMMTMTRNTAVWEPQNGNVRHITISLQFLAPSIKCMSSIRQRFADVHTCA